MIESIVKGCVIECSLNVWASTYQPLTVEVVQEEYVSASNGAVYHHFNVKILSHINDSKYSKYFPIGDIGQARACDLYNGRIVSFPENYDMLCAEKEKRKLKPVTV